MLVSGVQEAAAGEIDSGAGLAGRSFSPLHFLPPVGPDQVTKATASTKYCRKSKVAV